MDLKELPEATVIGPNEVQVLQRVVDTSMVCKFASGWPI